MSDAQAAFNRMVARYNEAQLSPVPIDKQIEADRLAWDRELRCNRITIAVAWTVWGMLVLAYIGFYYVVVPMHEAGLQP